MKQKKTRGDGLFLLMTCTILPALSDICKEIGFDFEPIDSVTKEDMERYKDYIFRKMKYAEKLDHPLAKDVWRVIRDVFCAFRAMEINSFGLFSEQVDDVCESYNILLLKKYDDPEWVKRSVN